MIANSGYPNVIPQTDLNEAVAHVVKFIGVASGPAKSTSAQKRSFSTLHKRAYHANTIPHLNIDKNTRLIYQGTCPINELDRLYERVHRQAGNG